MRRIRLYYHNKVKEPFRLPFCCKFTYFERVPDGEVAIGLVPRPLHVQHTLVHQLAHVEPVVVVQPEQKEMILISRSVKKIRALTFLRQLLTRVRILLCQQ